MTTETRKITRDSECAIINTNDTQLVLKDRLKNNIILPEYGDEDIVTVHDLQSMKTEHRKILEAGAIYIDDPEVVKYLRMERTVEGALSPSEFDKLTSDRGCTKLKAALENMSKEKLATFVRVANMRAKSRRLPSEKAREIIRQKVGPKNLTF